MKAPPPQQPPAGGANAAASANGAPPPPHVNAHARPFHPQQHHAPHHPHHHAPPGHFAPPYAPPQFPYGPPHGADGGPPPRGTPYHQEFRPKGGAPQEFHEQTNLPDGAADMPPSPFKPGAGMPLQPHARPFPGQPFIPGGHNGPMHGGMPPNMGGPQHMRGPPGPHGYQRMRGPPRGAPGGMPGQNYSGPRGGMHPRGQPYYMQQQQMYPGAYGMPPPGVPAPYMGAGGPMPGYPGQGMGMGMNHMPPPHAHTAHAAPPPQQREKKVLLIVDPKSGKAINATAAASTASSTPASSTAPSTPSKPTEATDSPAKQQAQATPKKPVVEESPKPASPTKKPSKPVGGTPGAGEEMLAKARALLAGKVDAKPKADSAPTPAAEKTPASSATPAAEKTPATSATPAPVPTSPKKTAKKPEASAKQPEAPAKKPEAPVPAPPSPKKTVPSSPKKKTPAATPVASPVAAKTKALSPKTPASPLKKEVKAEAKVEAKTASVVEAAKPVGESVNSVTIKENGKFTYTRDALLTFREMYTELPEDAKEGDLKWPAMDVTTDGTVRPRNARSGGGGGGGGGPGWDRGNEKPGLNRQSSRSSNGGGGQWQRSQDVPKRGRGERGGRGGGRGGRGAPEPLFDGPVKPLERTDNRWIPVKAESNLEAAKKKVQSIMNKMTREKFDKLAAQITEINMDSLEMLQGVIKLLFDKALGEPHFCDMYADLCVHLDQNWKVWSFLKIVQNDDDNKFYWTTMAESDSEVVGPFDGVTDALDSAASDEFEPTPAPEGLTLHEVRVREGKFIKIWARDQSGGDREYYWSGQLLEDLGDEQVLNGPFESHDLASRLAVKTCSFKRILLNACQEEFEKDNIYEELDEKFKKDKEDGSLTQEAIADYEEKRIITKARMLGNIRFIGELFRKGMLQERIMHECIMKLMGVKRTSEGLIEPSNPNNVPDEESIESLCKLLSTMGKDLDVKSSAALNMYFAYLERKMVKDKRLSSRIIFMIRDTIDLRANKWQPRRKELQSKSLNEIRKEAEREQRAPPASAPSGGGGGRPDSFRMDSRRSNSSRDGNFSQRSTMPPVYSSQSMNSRSGNVKQMTLPLDRRGLQRDDSVKTGPQGRPASFGSANPRRAPASAGPTLGKKTPSGRSGPPTPKNGAKDADRSASPVVAALSDDDKEKIAKKAKSIAEEYVSIVDLTEADACYVELLKEFKSHTEVHSVVATEILKLAIEAKADVQRPMFDLLEKLSVEKNSLSYPGIRAGIKETLELGNDLWCDVPKLHEHLAGFIVRFAKVSEKSGVTLDWLMCGCVESLEADIYEELIQGGFLAEVCGCVLTMLKDVSVEKANAQVRNTQVTLLSLFPDYKQTPKDFKQWIDKHAIGDALALQPAVEFALHWIESKDMEETVEWYQRTVPQDVQKDPVFSTLACLFVVGSVKKGSLPSDAEGMLLNGLCVSVESQTRFVAGLFQTVGAVPDEADNFKKLLKHLVKVERAIPGIALSKWLELKNDNSVGRKRALAAFGDFVEELSKTK